MTTTRTRDRRPRCAPAGLQLGPLQLRLLLGDSPSAVWTTDGDLRVASSLGAVRLLRLASSATATRSLKTVLRALGSGHPVGVAHRRALRGHPAVFERKVQGGVLEGRVEPLRDGDGQVVGCIGVVVDRTERTRSEAARLRLEALVQHAEDAIIVAGTDGTIEAWNPGAERLYGYEADEVIGRSIALVYPPGQRKAFRSAARRLAKGGRFVRHEEERRTKDGRRISVSLTASPIRDSRGHVTGISAIVRDVTAQKVADDELRRSHDELRRLAQHLATIREEEQTRISREIHDVLAQSLTALRFDLHQLLRAVPESQSSIRATVQRTLAHADEAIRAGRRISLDLRPPSLTDLGLVSALEWYVGDFAARTGLEHALVAQLDGAQIGNASALAAYRIAQEALINVERHAQATRVDLRVAVEGHDVVLEVRDDGVGIRQAAMASPRSIGIIGMRERARGRGGSVDVLNAPGGGTLVRAVLPLGERRRRRSTP
jgi:PAS domain S-box-containing protein